MQTAYVGNRRIALRNAMAEAMRPAWDLALAHPAGSFWNYASGTTNIGSSYCFCMSRDFARFGLLYLRDGVWDGRRLLPPGWVDYARTPSAPLRVTRKIALPYQDILRLLTLWFKYGGDTDVEVALMEAIPPTPHRIAAVPSDRRLTSTGSTTSSKSCADVARSDAALRRGSTRSRSTRGWRSSRRSSRASTRSRRRSAGSSTSCWCASGGSTRRCDHAACSTLPQSAR